MTHSSSPILTDRRSTASPSPISGPARFAPDSRPAPPPLRGATACATKGDGGSAACVAGVTAAAWAAG